jgi:hypothetical protein
MQRGQCRTHLAGDTDRRATPAAVEGGQIDGVVKVL